MLPRLVLAAIRTLQELVRFAVLLSLTPIMSAVLAPVVLLARLATRWRANGCLLASPVDVQLTRADAIVVIGAASSHEGEALVRAYARRGCTVYACDENRSKLLEFFDAEGPNVRCVSLRSHTAQADISQLRDLLRSNAVRLFAVFVVERSLPALLRYTIADLQRESYGYRTGARQAAVQEVRVRMAHWLGASRAGTVTSATARQTVEPSSPATLAGGFPRQDALSLLAGPRGSSGDNAASDATALPLLLVRELLPLMSGVHGGPATRIDGALSRFVLLVRPTATPLEASLAAAIAATEADGHGAGASERDVPALAHPRLASAIARSMLVAAWKDLGAAFRGQVAFGVVEVAHGTRQRAATRAWHAALANERTPASIVGSMLGATAGAERSPSQRSPSLGATNTSPSRSGSVSSSVHPAARATRLKGVMVPSAVGANGLMSPDAGSATHLREPGDRRSPSLAASNSDSANAAAIAKSPATAECRRVMSDLEACTSRRHLRAHTRVHGIVEAADAPVMGAGGPFEPLSRWDLAWHFAVRECSLDAWLALVLPPSRLRRYLVPAADDGALT